MPAWSRNVWRVSAWRSLRRVRLDDIEHGFTHFRLRITPVLATVERQPVLSEPGAPLADARGRARRRDPGAGAQNPRPLESGQISAALPGSALTHSLDHASPPSADASTLRLKNYE